MSYRSEPFTPIPTGPAGQQVPPLEGLRTWGDPNAALNAKTAEVAQLRIVLRAVAELLDPEAPCLDVNNAETDIALRLIKLVL